MLGSKRFKCNPVLDHELHPIPEDLKKTLALINKDFNNSRLMNMDLINTEGRLFGFMTSYVSSNFCWIQPTKTRSKVSSVEYHKYTKAINAVPDRDWADDLYIGKHCVAQYEVDKRWYRAIVVGEPIDNEWLVQFIDYGNYQRCSACQIGDPIQKSDCDHFDVPLQAVCCRLYNIVPKLPEYRDLIDTKLESFYATHCMDYLEIVVRNVRPDFVVDCDVFLARPHGPQDFYRRHIGQELVDLGLAIFADPHRAHVLKPSPIERITVDFEEEREDLKKEYEDIKLRNSTARQEDEPAKVITSKPNRPLYKYQNIKFF